LLGRLQALDAATEQSSIRYWWGPYTARPVRDALRILYLERLRQTAEGPLREQLAASVRSVGDLPNLDPESFTEGYDSLHLYLMLADPARLDPEYAMDRLARVWQQASQRGALGGNSPVGAHVQHYVEQLQADKSWAWPEDGILVERARGRLASMPVDVIAYSALEAAAKGAPPIRPDQIFVGASARFLTTKGKVEVPGLYTRLGWEKVRPLLKEEKEMHFAPWVLGQGSADGEAAWSVEQLRNQYFERYERAWYDFFLGLNIATPGTLRSAIDELAALGKVDGPYVRLFRRFTENVRLEYEKPTLLEKIVDKVEDKVEKKVEKAAKEDVIQNEPERKITPVERDFARLTSFAYGDTPPSKDTPQNELPPAPLGQYLEQLRTLEVSLRQIEEASVEPGEQFKEELARTSVSVEKLLTKLSQQERLIIEPLLMNPIRGSQSAVAGAASQNLNDRWRQEVWEPYHRMVSRYPFVASSAYEVPLSDFAEFFRPGTGTIWAFYEENLSSRLLRSGTRFTPRPAEARSGFRGDFLSCLANAQNISEAMFRGDTAEPSVPMLVKMQASTAAVSETTLRVDGQALVYKNTPEAWEQITWPGKDKDGPAGASIQVRGASFKDEIRRYGEFAFIRLLAEGGAKPVAPGAVDLEASWDLNRGETRVAIQFRPPASRHPFQKGFFSSFQCPSAIISGGGNAESD
ncbi:MAG TPA: ImcF-related family protein, partial [Polyangiaceae bacterium]|nr:ImcF-related family protein [Polyangiaceae bacterium]